MFGLPYGYMNPYLPYLQQYAQQPQAVDRSAPDIAPEIPQIQNPYQQVTAQPGNFQQLAGMLAQNQAPQNYFGSLDLTQSPYAQYMGLLGDNANTG